MHIDQHSLLVRLGVLSVDTLIDTQMTVLLEKVHLARLASYFLGEAVQAIEPKGFASRDSATRDATIRATRVWAQRVTYMLLPTLGGTRLRPAILDHILPARLRKVFV